MAKTIEELLVQYRECQKKLLSGCVYGFDREELVNTMSGILAEMETYPFPFCAGDRVCHKSYGREGTVIYAEFGVCVVRYDRSLSPDAYNGYEARTRLYKL